MLQRRDMRDPDFVQYMGRVAADGGIVVNPEHVQNSITWAKHQGLWHSLVHWTSASFGFKAASGLGGGALEKLYCLKGNDAVQATSGNRPTWSLTGTFPIASRPVSIFDGTDDFLSIPSGISIDPQKLTAMQVINTTGGGSTFSSPFGHRDEATRLFQFLLQTTTDCRLTLRDSAGTIRSLVDGTGINTTHVVICGVMDRVADSHRFRRDAATAATDTTDFGANTFTSALNTIGASNDGAYINFHKGNIAETAIIEEAITTTQEAALRSLWTTYYTM